MSGSSSTSISRSSAWKEFADTGSTGAVTVRYQDNGKDKVETGHIDVSPDLANGALPLYLSRPLTRTGYTLGKISVLAALISIITWVPGFLLFLLQSWLAGWEWFASHAWLGVAIVGGAIIWIVTISLLALATSALARRKVVAQTFLLGVIIFGAVAGQAVNVMFGTKIGFLFNLPVVMQSVWNSLYRLSMPTAFPAPVALVALLVICGISVAILAKKLKAFEVVK
jgi:ABC-2 type transport system permease protein